MSMAITSIASLVSVTIFNMISQYPYINGLFSKSMQNIVILTGIVLALLTLFWIPNIPIHNANASTRSSSGANK